MCIYNGDIGASVTSLILVLVDIIFPIAVWLIIYRNKKNLRNPTFKVRYGSLYDETNTYTWGAYYGLIYLLRRIIFAILAVFMIGFPSQQL